MKHVFFLTGDFWHHTDTIEPLVKVLFDDSWEVHFTERPEEMLQLETTPDLIITFKDPIENDQIPTPVWCDEIWTKKLFENVIEKGTGFLVMHAAVTDMEPDHPIVRDMIQSLFISHPAPCPVTFRPTKEHPILEGVSEFTFSGPDEHYVMSMIDNADVEIIANTVSQNGTQPGMWVKQLGAGRICCITPGHTTENLMCNEYVKVMKNAITWCSK